MPGHEREQPNLRSFVRDKSLDLFENLTESGYKIEIENRENLSVLAELSRLPVVMYYNHMSKDDPFLAIYLVKRFAQDRLKNVIIPVSEKYSHLYNYPQYATSVFLGKEAAGFSMPSIIQSYRLRTEESDKDLLDKLKHKSSTLGREFIKLLDAKLPGNPLIILSPEGHISSDGKLLPCEAGMGYIVNKLARLKEKGIIEDAILLPVGFVFSQYKGRRLHYKPFKSADLKCLVGEPQSIDDASYGVRELTSAVLGHKRSDSQTLSNFLMWRLSKLLPDNMRGVYADDIFRDTLLGRFELRMLDKSDRKAGVYDSWEKKFVGR